MHGTDTEHKGMDGGGEGRTEDVAGHEPPTCGGRREGDKELRRSERKPSAQSDGIHQQTGPSVFCTSRAAGATCGHATMN